MREAILEAENNARGIAKVVPVHLIGRSRHPLEKVVRLPEPQADVACDVPIQPHARAHRKAVGSNCCSIKGRVRVGKSEQGLHEWIEFRSAKE